MTITLQDKHGRSVSYNISDIEYIEHNKGRNLYDVSELAGNNIKPTDSLLVIHFLDGSTASFSSNWAITFS